MNMNVAHLELHMLNGLLTRAIAPLAGMPDSRLVRWEQLGGIVASDVVGTSILHDHPARVTYREQHELSPNGLGRGGGSNDAVAASGELLEY